MFSEPGDARARVRFTEFASSDDPMLLAWARFRGALFVGPASAPTRVRPTPADDPTSGLWRLLATNNRELGRSFLLYHRFETARTHVMQLQADPDSLRVEHVSGPINGSRGWVMMAEDAPVMTCSRWYSSLSSGAAAGAGALDAFRTALLTDAPDRSDASGRFRRRVATDADALS